jgi:hypothetical protein
VKTIEELQQIVVDESRDTESRKQAAEHILALQAKAEAPADDAVRQAFALMRLSPEQINEDEDRRVDAENAVRKACPECFHCQPVTNEDCDLCGSTPDSWPPSLVRRPRINHQGHIVDKAGTVLVPLSRAVGAEIKSVEAANCRRWMSTSFTTEELQHVVAHTGDPDSAWRIQHAARILRLRGVAVPHTLCGQEV